MRNVILFSIRLFFAIAVLVFITACPGDKEDDEEYLNAPEELEGYFIFTHATFTEAVDVDGEGPRLPTSDALQIMYDLFDIYSNCPTEDTTIFEFKDYDFYHYCSFTQTPEYIARISYIPGVRFILDDFELSDPADLFWESPFYYFLIDQSNRVDGAWIFQGRCALGINAYPENMQWFNYELKEISN